MLETATGTRMPDWVDAADEAGPAEAALDAPAAAPEAAALLMAPLLEGTGVATVVEAGTGLPAGSVVVTDSMTDVL